MFKPHVRKQMEERGLRYEEKFLLELAEKCKVDTAIILEKLPRAVEYQNQYDSNGDLVILIVRNKYPVTVFFRRSWNQEISKSSLSVREIIPFYKTKKL